MVTFSFSFNGNYKQKISNDQMHYMEAIEKVNLYLCLIVFSRDGRFGAAPAFSRDGRFSSKH